MNNKNISNNENTEQWFREKQLASATAMEKAEILKAWCQFFRNLMFLMVVARNTEWAQVPCCANHSTHSLCLKNQHWRWLK